ncbi:MAG: 3-methylmercaptopropionyl-CoA dehydrogenase [Alphaproteobacteria bacterium MarineAlpha2_Bin1]|nr:MAG: 3-methylmercaptopropionyl-CoA dehydrogenase [Alphaproteobacteria bacterium MarineAlpha2_Bin1]
MQKYEAPIKDIKYLINSVFKINNYSNLDKFKKINPETTNLILEEASKFTQNVLLPLNQLGDLEGCKFIEGDVQTPEGFKEAYNDFIEGGWSSLTFDEEFGGQGLPTIIGVIVSEMIVSTNMAFGMYPGLTQGAYKAIEEFGNSEQKKLYLPKFAEGKWTGTMNLTEPQCGTDLGLIKTKAEPITDGSYSITGSKIFISAGEHDLSENIIHLVLARLPDAPPGIKGISLFIVPKFLPNDKGELSERNYVNCVSIENKMGIKASSTCEMKYESATGYLLGEKNKGMRAMFIMMNEARLGVGIQGLGMSEVAYQSAAEYTKDRLQGRSLVSPLNPELPADPIIVHPDVRRMLLSIRSFNEAARSLSIWIALNIDIAEHHPDTEIQKNASDFVALMTPIAKAFLTDSSFENVNLALQCYGGHGYIRDHGMEQFVRDTRITQLYEGTSGIQALDLVGRKLPQDMGRLLRQFFHPVDKFIKENISVEDLSEIIMPLAKSFARLQQASAWVAENGMSNPNEAAGASSDYLKLFGFVALGYMWAMMAKTSHFMLNDEDSDIQFHQDKINLSKFYMNKVLPETSSLLSKITAGSKTLMSIKNSNF